MCILSFHAPICLKTFPAQLLFISDMLFRAENSTIDNIFLIFLAKMFFCIKKTTIFVADS